jgi:hypothetical protein
METKNEKPLPKMLPGYVCAQWKKCGKSNCRCVSGELHGPYYYRFWWDGGRQHKSFIRKADVERVREACEAYRRVKALTRENRTRQRRHMRYLQQLLATLRGHELHVASMRRLDEEPPN